MPSSLRIFHSLLQSTVKGTDHKVVNETDVFVETAFSMIQWMLAI